MADNVRLWPDQGTGRTASAALCSGTHHNFPEHITILRRLATALTRAPVPTRPSASRRLAFCSWDRQLSALGAARPSPRIPARSPVRSDCVEKVEFEVVVVAGTSEERTRMPGSPAQAAQVSAGAGISLASGTTTSCACATIHSAMRWNSIWPISGPTSKKNCRHRSIRSTCSSYSITVINGGRAYNWAHKPLDRQQDE